MIDRSDPPAFSLGKPQGELSFVLQQRPGRGSYDFGKFEVNVVSGKFRGSTDCYFARTDFEALLQALRNFDEFLKGTHNFSTLEEQLNFELAIDKFGHLHCEGELFEQAGGWGNSVKFEISFDQTALKPLIRDLQKFIQSFDL